ncbi:centrosomal protein of 55 kDa-like isoform X2 [Melanotaenia boesemani]|uniref:centrosomal protein of 55 kDa-like isoform X2 n=1 Tax=Melanotaenia boesemani TaxID=1250792 RepID=UPI001C04E4A5|nr:centrosomal protein of 55 kDa-like isoform X2 [Melanotaenia boesemani]
MAASKFKRSLKKKLNSELSVIISNLRKENTYLKKTLAEVSRHHADHNKLVERFLSLETMRLEGCQQLTAKDEKAALSTEELCTKEGNSTDGVTMRRNSTSIYTEELEEIKNKLASISSKCQYLESKVSEKQETPEQQASISDGVVSELQSQLNDALKKNKQWLEYDQQREAYVRVVVARILELEKQLRQASQTRSQHHNEDYSDDVRLSQMQERYKELLQKAKNEKEVLQEQAEVTQQRLTITQNRCREKEKEVDELKQQLQSERMSKESAQEEHHSSQDEEQPQRDEAKELKVRLNEEKRRSASFEMQANLFQRYMLNRHHADQERVDDLQRRENQQESEELHLPSQPSRHSLTSSAHSSILNESLLECPSCQAEYSASQYRELLHHLENCLE